MFFLNRNSASPPVVSLTGVGFGFDGAPPLLCDIDLDLRPGEWTVALGPPGGGKTSLLKLVSGMLAPTQGGVSREGACALVLQDEGLDDTVRARALVAQAAPRPHDDAQACALLEALGLGAYLDHTPFQLSRGHKRRLAIACALAAQPAVLCLDDPFGPLDRAARRMTGAVLRRAAVEQGLAILMVSNDPADALALADRIIVLSPGPGARIAAVHSNNPSPDLAPAAAASNPLYRALETAMWAQA